MLSKQLNKARRLAFYSGLFFFWPAMHRKFKQASKEAENKYIDLVMAKFHLKKLRKNTPSIMIE